MGDKGGGVTKKTQNRDKTPATLQMDALYRYGRARLFRFCLFSFGMFQVVDLGDGINQFAVAAAGF